MKTSLKLLLPILSAVALAACGGGGGDSGGGTGGGTDGGTGGGTASPKVRLVHAIPTAVGKVTLSRSGTPFSPATGMSYKDASVYADTTVSNDLWIVRTDTNPALDIGSVTFPAVNGHKYTFVAIPDTNPVTSLQMIDDPYSQGIATDRARVRVFNAALNATNIDVYLTPATTDINTVAPTFATVGYKRALPTTGSDSLNVDGGAYVLRITAAGAAAPKTVIFSAPVTLAKNADWLLLPIPASATPNDLKVLVVQSDAATPAVELTNTP